MKASPIFIIILLMLACASQISSDIYIPSLLSISKALSGGTLNLAQLSVAIFLYGVSFSQLIYGPISEGIGRKKTLMIGLIIMILGSLFCIISSQMMHLIVGRLIQGIGVGALAALWRSIFRDMMSGEELAKYSSFVSIFMILAVSIAPTLGGYFEQIGWRSSFVFMMMYASICLLCLIFLFHETSQQHHHDKLKLFYILNTYKSLLSSSYFMGIAFCTLLTYGALFSWIVVSPALLMNKIGITPILFGWLISITGVVSYMAAAYVNSLFVKRVGMATMMRTGWLFTFIAGLSLWGSYYFFGLQLWALMIPVVIFYFGSTLIWPNAFASAFTPFGHIAGYTGALYGFMQLAGGAVMGSLIANLPDNDQRYLGGIMMVTSLFAYLIYQRCKKPAAIA